MKHTVEGWRLIGRAYERVAAGDRSQAGGTPYVRHGLCAAARSLGFPSYDDRGSVPLVGRSHGNTLADSALIVWTTKAVSGGYRKQAAHRALSAYLIAEMLETGDLPLCR